MSPGGQSPLPFISYTLGELCDPLTVRDGAVNDGFGSRYDDALAIATELERDVPETEA